MFSARIVVANNGILSCLKEDSKNSECLQVQARVSFYKFIYLYRYYGMLS